MPKTHDSLNAFTSALQPARRLWKQAARMVLSTSGLSVAVATPVVLVSKLGDGVLQQVIAERIGVHPAAITRTLDQAEQAGLLERRVVPGNRRARAIYLLPEGRRLAAKMERALRRLRTELLQDVPEADIEVAIRVLQSFEQQARFYVDAGKTVTSK